MNDIAQKLYTEMEEELTLIHDFGDLPVKRLSAALSVIKGYTTKLNDILAAHTFASPQAEIEYFKHWKPRFQAERIYALEKYALEISQPLTDSRALRIYYLGELQFVQRFFNQHQFLYQYYKLQFSELDANLFIRGARPLENLVFESADIDETLETPAGHLFAKFMAHEKLRAHILDQLNTIPPAGQPHTGPRQPGDASPQALTWTGETINLVELAYGIWLTGQLNNGNATISDVIRWLETHLNTRIGRPFRRWTEIAQRKSLSPTKFLDQMTQALHHRLNDELTLKTKPRNQ